MRCLLILRMQRRVELLRLRSLCILMQLAGIHRMLGFVERLLGLFHAVPSLRRGKKPSADSGQAGWYSAAAAQKPSANRNGCRYLRVSG